MVKQITMLFVAIMLLSVTGIAQTWVTDFDQAKRQAEEKNRPILLVFSGVDWCVPCMKLENNIWQSEEFKSFAKDHYVLLKADFPKQKKNRLSVEQQAHNDRLSEKYNPNGYFPLVVLLGKNGKVIGNTGFKNLAPAEYIKHLQSLEK